MQDTRQNVDPTGAINFRAPGRRQLHQYTPRALSHAQLAEVLHATLKIGALMMRSGSATFRAEQVMRRVSAALGADRLEAFVTTTGIVATVRSSEDHRTEIIRISTLGVDMNRVIELEQFTRNLPSDPTPSYIREKIAEIEAMGPQYSPSMRAFAVAVGCGALAVILGGGLPEMIGATLGAGAAQIVRMRMARAHFSPIPITVVCAAVATSYSYLVAWLSIQFAPLIAELGIRSVPRFGVIASVLLLVPGVPLVTSILDLTRLDLVSGTARAAYGLLLVVCIAVGLLLVLTWTGFHIL